MACGSIFPCIQSQQQLVERWTKDSKLELIVFTRKLLISPSRKSILLCNTARSGPCEAFETSTMCCPWLHQNCIWRLWRDARRNYYILYTRRLARWIWFILDANAIAARSIQNSMPNVLPMACTMVLTISRAQDMCSHTCELGVGPKIMQGFLSLGFFDWFRKTQAMCNVLSMLSLRWQSGARKCWEEAYFQGSGYIRNLGLTGLSPEHCGALHKHLQLIWCLA